MKPNLFESSEDQKILKNNKNNIFSENIIFREFNKIKDKYIATNNFYISCEDDDNKCDFKNVDINLLSKNNRKKIFYSGDNNLYYTIDTIEKKEYINLILISNISFSMNDIYINKDDLLKKFINNNYDIDENILEDIYYDKSFSKKIKLDIPYNDNTLKKYLFKINSNEINQTFYQEDNKLFL
jgi:hypothetical protein